MAARFFQVGDLVWGKLDPHTLRPGKILPPIEDIDRCEPSHYIYLFGIHEYRWLPESQLLQHTEELLEQAEHWPEDSFVTQAIIELKRELAKQEGEHEELSPLINPIEYFLPTESVSDEESFLAMDDSNLEKKCSFPLLGDYSLLPENELFQQVGYSTLLRNSSVAQFEYEAGFFSGEEASEGSRKERYQVETEPISEEESSLLPLEGSFSGEESSLLPMTESTLLKESSHLPVVEYTSGEEERRRKRTLSNSMQKDETESPMKISRLNDSDLSHPIQSKNCVSETSESHVSKPYREMSYYDASKSNGSRLYDASISYPSTSNATTSYEPPTLYVPTFYAPISDNVPYNAPTSYTASISHASRLLGNIPNDTPILVDNERGFNSTASTSRDNSNEEVSLPLFNKSKPSTSVQINANNLSSNDYITINNINRKSFNAKSVGGKSAQSYISTELDRMFETIVKTCSSRIAEAPEYVRATEKEIGVLGIGQMGSAIVKNLLDTGHCITMWNRDPKKMILKDFLDDGAEIVKNPSDLVKNCDIVFCCLSNEEAVDEVFNGVDGILQGFKNEKSKNEKSKNKKSKNKKNEKSENQESLKGFVQLTSLDPKISKKLSDAISKEGGRYLEVSVLGSKDDAKNRSLTFVCAGDDLLFQDCFTCFASNSTDAVYMGKHVERAMQMKVILSLITGATNVALKEVVSLVVQKKLPLNIFMDFIREGPISCPAIRNRANALMDIQNTEIVTGIHSHKGDFLLSSHLTECSEKSMIIAACVNEYYLTAKKLY